jgi:hypothetical protein
LIGRITLKRVATGEIEQADFATVGGEKFSRFFRDGNASVIPNFLVGPGQGIENGRFPRIRVSSQSNGFEI